MAAVVGAFPCLSNETAHKLRTEMSAPTSTNVPQRAHGAPRPHGTRHSRQFVSFMRLLGGGRSGGGNQLRRPPARRHPHGRGAAEPAICRRATPATRPPDRAACRPTAMSDHGPRRTRATQINVPPRANGGRLPRRAEHSWTERRSPHPYQIQTKFCRWSRWAHRPPNGMQISCRPYTSPRPHK
jgi:hypothetical protein